MIVASLENTARLMRDDKQLPLSQRTAVVLQCDRLVAKFANNLEKVLAPDAKSGVIMPN